MGSALLSLPTRRLCSRISLATPSLPISTATITTVQRERQRGPSMTYDMSVQKSGRGLRVVASNREKRNKGDSPSITAMSCFFCKETGHASIVTLSLLESMMKVKAYMCIPIRFRDTSTSEVALCPKCFDIVAQIEGWVDKLRTRIFDAHEGAVLYPETPPWLHAMVASSSEVPAKSPSNSTPSAVGKRKNSSDGVSSAPVPPKKLAAAAAVAEENVSVITLPVSEGVPFLTIPVSAPLPANTTEANSLSKNAMKSAIDSLTSLVNVVRSSPSNPPEPERTVVKEEPRGNSHGESPSPTPPFDLQQRWCSVCSSSYHNDSVFKRHIVSTHPEMCFKCDLCGQLFASSNSRDIHVSHGCCERPTNRTRVLRCTDCHATFLGKYELKRHVLLTSHMGGVSGQT